MSRPLRVDIEGCWYHVVARGNERRKLFINRQERLFYLQLLDETARMSRATFCAYSLVPNHVHLLICRGRKSLAKLIQRVHGNYAAYFNRNHRRAGHLFEGRYHAYLVTDEQYLNSLIRYIHENLPKAKLGKENNDPLWSSHSLYAERNDSPWSQWIKAPGFEGREGMRAYRQLLDTEDGGLPPVSSERPWAYGTASAWRKFERRLIGREAKKRREQRGVDRIERIVSRISKKKRVSLDLLKSSSRAREITSVRNEAILDCLKVGHGSTEISRFFMRRPASVTTVIQRYGDPRKINA